MSRALMRMRSGLAPKHEPYSTWPTTYALDREADTVGAEHDERVPRDVLETVADWLFWPGPAFLAAGVAVLLMLEVI